MTGLWLFSASWKKGEAVKIYRYFSSLFIKKYMIVLYNIVDIFNREVIGHGFEFYND